MTCKPTTLATKYAQSYMRDSSFFDIPSFADMLRRETNPIERFDRQTLLRTSQALNRTLNLTKLNDYPYLQSRVSQGPILYAEIGDFLIQTGMNLDRIHDIVTTVDGHFNTIAENEVDAVTGEYKNGTPSPLEKLPSDYGNVIDQLENYYVENIANTVSGGFCGAFSFPFEQILKAAASIKLGVDLINKIANFSLDDLYNRLDTLKEKLLLIVDQLRENLLQQVQSIVDGVVDQIQGLARSAERISNEIFNRVQDARSFLETLSVVAIKEEIERFVKQSVEQFEELTPETISLLMFRFCQFAELIQSFMRGPVDALKNFAFGVMTEYQLLQSWSSPQTRRAVRSGAVRLSESGIRDGQRRMAAMAARSNTGDDSMDPPETRSYVRDPNLTLEDRKSLYNMTENGVVGRLIFSDSVRNMSAADAPRGSGWRRVRPEVWAKAVVASREFGRPLIVNSAYRSRLYNDAIRSRGGGAARNSLHISGMALDINTDGMSDSQIRSLIRIYSQVGFTGMSVYNTFIHVDIGARRTWGNNGRFSSSIATHLNDGYRRGDVEYNHNYDREEFSVGDPTSL